MVVVVVKRPCLWYYWNDKTQCLSQSLRVMMSGNPEKSSWTQNKWVTVTLHPDNRLYVILHKCLDDILCICVCGHRCGQAKFCWTWTLERTHCLSECSASFYGKVRKSSLLPKQARYQLRYTPVFCFTADGGLFSNPYYTRRWKLVNRKNCNCLLLPIVFCRKKGYNILSKSGWLLVGVG